jgi:diguanylate cyclase (GGDEF)-like protein
MFTVDPGPGKPASGEALVGAPFPTESPTTVMAHVASVVRLIVLLTVALMLRLREPFVPAAPLDILLAVGSAYVVVTTFFPRRPVTEHPTRLFLICDIVLISGLIWYTGGSSSEYYLLYYLPIIHAASRLDFRDAITTSVLAGLSYVFIAIASGPMVPVVTNGLLRAATFGGSVLILAVFFAALAQEARSNRVLTARLQEALASVSAVYDVVRAANTRDSVQDVWDTMLRQAMRLSEADSGLLAMLDDDGKFQVVVRHQVEGAPEAQFDDKLAHEAIEKRERVAREEPSAGPQPVLRELFVPLLAGRTPLAVVQVRSSSPTGVNPRDVELLRAMCAEGAMAIENVRLRVETKRAAAVDYLTGLYNRREFERRLEAEIRRTARHGGEVALVLLDADDFKYCNDSYGHQAGDQVLQALAARVGAVIRSEDTAARYGGDEFAVVLPQTNVAGACAAAEKIQRELQQLCFGWADDGWQLSVSIGVASSEDELSSSLLLQKADRALYQAKGAGKNQICVWRRGSRLSPRAA